MTSKQQTHLNDKKQLYSPYTNRKIQYNKWTSKGENK